MVSKPGGGTLLDLLRSATPFALLEPSGEHEVHNAQLWCDLGLECARWCEVRNGPRHPPPRVLILTICRDEGFLPGSIRHARNPNVVHGLVLAGRGIHLNEASAAQLVGGLV
ncbi:hypothetical protein ACF08M_15855 [Streptomyces sp. NPDC015032]|uniref:hypothetical protein n=1 Tax=Streptomyces sp. NPDC015032 TaxID=3364937 RepID=UPI0037002210